MITKHPQSLGVVSDVYGDQIQIGSQWYHAERIFGRHASTYKVGDVVESFARSEPVSGKTPEQHDELVSADLFRESGANITLESKVNDYFNAMIGYSGWGSFPPVSGYVCLIDLADVLRYREMEELGCAHELGWSRPLVESDVGVRYVHLTEGHHRAHAARRFFLSGYQLHMPAIDLGLQERTDNRYLSHHD